MLQTSTKYHLNLLVSPCAKSSLCPLLSRDVCNCVRWADSCWVLTSGRDGVNPVWIRLGFPHVWDVPTQPVSSQSFNQNEGDEGRADGRLKRGEKSCLS